MIMVLSLYYLKRDQLNQKRYYTIMEIFRENSKPPKPLFSENKTLLHEPQLLRLRQQRLQWTKKAETERNEYLAEGINH